jgi:hypothetical protein
MPSRSSPLLRIGRAVTALVTVWCLGCSSFEPLLDSLLGAEGTGMMSCASEQMAQPSAGEPTVASTGTPAGSPTLDLPPAGSRFSCACTSCQAPTPQAPIVAAVAEPMPGIEPSTLTTPLSVTRAPIAPPPEATA